MAPDWLILTIQPSPRNGRYYIIGENLSADTLGRVFHWHVRDIKDPRYAAHPDATPEMREAVRRAKEE